MDEAGAGHAGNSSVRDHLAELEAASKLPAKRRAVNIKPTVQALTALVYERGILPDDLIRLVGLVAAPSHLDQATLGTLIKGLYPVGEVPDDVVLAVVGCLGHGELKPSLVTQSLLLRWLVMVFHVLGSHAVLSRCYPVLFNLLETAALRPQLCHLLALITRRKHVRPFRIQSVLEISRNTGHDPSLVGLLRVYKNYYPDVVVGDATKGRASPFKYPDTEWRERLGQIQSAHRMQKDRERADPRTANGFRVNHRLNGRKGVLVPSVMTSHARDDSMILEEIDNVEQFVQNLEKIELPVQLVAVLADPLLQKLLALRPDEQSDARIANWLEACLHDAVTDAKFDGGSALLDLVEVFHDYAVQTKTLHPLFGRLLESLYPVWDGRSRRAVVLDTLAYLPLQPFATAYENHLQRLEGKVLDNTPEPLLALVGLYTSLLRRWTVAFLSADKLPEHTAQTLVQLKSHVNRLSLTIFQATGIAAASAQLRILGFYKWAASLFAHPVLLQHIELLAPPPALVYTMVFSPSPAVLSELCCVLARYKRGLESAMVVARPRRRLTPQDLAQIEVFNGFFMDVVNLLWRVRAFDRKDKNAVGCGVPEGVIKELAAWTRSQSEDGSGAAALAGAYGLSRNPALCLQSISFVRKLEDAEVEEHNRAAVQQQEGGEDVTMEPPPLLARHAGPVTQQSLRQLTRDGGLELAWQDYRLGVLEDLEQSGLRGIPELLYQTMKTLKQSQNGSQESSQILPSGTPSQR